MKLLMPSQQGRAADLGARLPILRKHGLSTAHDPLGPLEVRERHEHAAIAAAEHDLAELVVGQRGRHDDTARDAAMNRSRPSCICHRDRRAPRITADGAAGEPFQSHCAHSCVSSGQRMPALAVVF